MSAPARVAVTVWHICDGSRPRADRLVIRPCGGPGRCRRLQRTGPRKGTPKRPDKARVTLRSPAPSLVVLHPGAPQQHSQIRSRNAVVFRTGIPGIDGRRWRPIGHHRHGCTAVRGSARGSPIMHRPMWTSRGHGPGRQSRRCLQHRGELHLGEPYRVAPHTARARSPSRRPRPTAPTAGHCRQGQHLKRGDRPRSRSTASLTVASSRPISSPAASV